MKRFFGILSASLATAAAFGAVSYSGGSYSQNFDTLPVSGTANTWTNDTTLPGWFAMNSLPQTPTGARSGRDAGTWNATAVMRAGDGSVTNGALYSFGTGTSTERALGSIGSGTPGDFIYALVLQNNTGFTMTSFSLTYNGEQWRDGGNADSRRQMLDFDYATISTNPGNSDLQGVNLAGYSGYDPTVWTNDSSTSLDQTFGTILTGVSANAVPGVLDFNGPIGTTTGAPVNGNAAGLVSGINGVIGVNWLPGEYLVLRWWDNNSVGNDHGLAIDDVNFSATPEPASLALIALGGLMLMRRR